MKKAPLLLSLMSFLLFFSLLIRVKNFKSKPLFVQGALLLCLLLRLFFLSANPPLGCQISLPTSTTLSVTLRDFPPCSSSPFQALLHLHWIAFRNGVTRFREPT